MKKRIEVRKKNWRTATRKEKTTAKEATEEVKNKGMPAAVTGIIFQNRTLREAENQEMRYVLDAL